jgi:hypothetical protein
MMQKANVSHGTAKMDKMVRRRESPCVRRLGLLYRERVVRGADQMSMKLKKVLKKQRKGLGKESAAL